MTMFTLSAINVFNTIKSLGQLLLLFVLGVFLLALSTSLVSVSGQWDWLAFGVLVGTLPFICFYLAGFLLAPKRFYQARIWKHQPSSLRWGVAIVCALSGYFSMGELNSVADISAPAQPMPLFDQLLITLSAVMLFGLVYMPLRAVSLFRSLGLGKTNAIGEVFEEHNKDICISLAVPPVLMGIVVLVMVAYLLAAFSASNFPHGAKYTLMFVLEITAASEIAYVYRNRTKGGISLLVKGSPASQA